MKKMFAIAIVTLALAACGGKPKAEDTMGNTGGDMAGSGAETGGTGYGGTTYGNPCGNPCGTAPNPCNPCGGM
jgi:hypothetical protein